jgi:multidrug efflux pump
VKNELPHLEAAMPADINVIVAIDRSTTIRASLHDTEKTLVLAVLLVTIVVFLFLGNVSATLIPSVAVPISIFGTFGVMYLLGYSLDILSLMALTIATGFVVDDAIVVMENISRHIEDGVPRVQAAFLGAREVGFTVLSISLSLIAVFIPILLMGGILGRLFREFTVTLSVAILVSLAISLTTTPMMCALFLRLRPRQEAGGRLRIMDRIRNGYGHTLTWALRHAPLVMVIFIATICLNIALYIVVPKGFFPQQDTGRMLGSMEADQSISFQLMSSKLRQMMDIVRADPAVDQVVGYTGVGSGGGYAQINKGNVFVSLKPISERVSVDHVIARLRPQLARVPGGRLYMAAVQDLRAGGRQSNAQYQYTLQSENVEDLYTWTPKLVEALEHNPVLTDVSSDQQQRGLETYLDIDRDTTARLGVSPLQIDNTLYDAFGQRQVSVIYSAINQYHVVMEIDPRYTQYPNSLNDVYVSLSGATPAGTATTNASAGNVTAATAVGTTATQPVAITSPAVTASPASAFTIVPASGTSAAKSTTATTTAASSANVAAARNAFTNALANTGHGSTSAGAAVSTSLETMIPLAAVSRYRPGHTPLSVNHQGLFVASTISFNLQPGKSLGQAAEEINAAKARIHMPSVINGTLAGTAQLFQQSLSKEPILILTAIAAVYILLGVLYESYIHPITILSTLPSAGVGALLALMLFHVEFDIIGLIGVILLIGIVKKNAIMMVDFAIEAKRARDLTSYDAIYEACLLRFRPIMMTTSAAILGAIPLALSFGNGGEIRRPLGIAIVGGLIISQLLTLYTTPVLYLYLDRLSGWSQRVRDRMFGRRPPRPLEAPSAS